jgi:hypothetical protein
MKTAALDALRRRAINELDFDNLAEEIESVGRSERRESPARNPSYPPPEMALSARETERQLAAPVSEARRRIEDVLADNPSLRSFPAEALAGAYRLAILDEAIRRLELMHLPEACPWAIEDVLRDDFWP